MPISKSRLLSASLFGLLLGFVLLPLSAAAQTTAPNEWTWMGGSSLSATGDLPGVYGTLGTPAAGNAPGSRYGAANWSDSAGNLWLFGGYGYDSTGVGGYLDDLWEFNSSTNQWAWMGGSNTIPPPTNSIYEQGLPGVFGTFQTPAAGNIPGSRSGAAAWTDSKGNFWLFGGYGFDSADHLGDLNDIWEFNPTTNVWTWMGGSSTNSGSCVGGGVCGQPGMYGILGKSASGNMPGGRQTIDRKSTRLNSSH